ncbi:MAG: hypothetical protein ACRDJV_14380 [Actinomycetota bacterium]
MKAEVLERQTAKLATSYPMRFKTLLKWDPSTDLWLAFVPVLGPLCVCAASRNEALESTKKAIRSYIDPLRWAALGYLQRATRRFSRSRLRSR